MNWNRLRACLLIATTLTTVSMLSAQDIGTNPPDAAPLAGTPPLGAYSPSQIETVNTVNGNMLLRFPVGSLPPGPGGFSPQINLIYNSAIYDVQELPYSSTIAGFNYYPSQTGGGWTYAYKYTLWAQGRVSNFVTSEELTYFWKNFLTTPDGNSHELYLVSANPAPGSTAPSQDQYGYCQLTFQGRGGAPYSGTLVFATGDSTFIRVEVNTTTEMFTIFLPDGTTATGSTAADGLASSATTITDPNNNTLTIQPICPVREPCQDTLTDGQGRRAFVNYSATQDGAGWTDTIQSPGPNGTNTTVVTWSSFNPPSVTSNFKIDLNGVSQQTQPLSSMFSTYSAVSSIQMPSADNVNSVFYNFGYAAIPGTLQTWGEVHTASECVGTSAACTNEWTVNYTYAFDTQASTARPAGTRVNPLSQKQLTYIGALQPETTSYSFLYPQNVFATYPQGSIGSNTITGPDNGTTTIYLENLCASSQLARDSCAPLIYKTQNPDLSTTEFAWVANTLPNGTSIPSGTIFNPYIQWKVETRPGSAANVARATFLNEDSNGNPVTLAQYDWSPASAATHSGSLLTGFNCSCQLVSQTMSYYNADNYYWSPGAPLLHLPNTQTNGSATTTYTFTGPNLTQVQQYDNATSLQITQSRSYLSNGNVWAEFDADRNATVTCYDNNNLYPMTRLAGAMNVSTGTAYSASVCSSGYPEARTTSYNYDGLNGVLLSVTDSDNKLATSFTYDNWGRAKAQAQSAPTLSRNASTVYDDVNLKVTTTQDDTASQQLVTAAQYDGLGRLSYTKDGAGDQISKSYAYYNGGSYELQSNPYTAATAASDTDSSMGWTRTTHDLAGRVTNVQNYLGAQSGSALGPPAPWGSNTTVTGSSSVAYDQNFANCPNPGVTATDEANDMRQYCTDGLGRLLTVIEPPASGNPATNTRYRYDNLSNLISVDVDNQPTYCTGSDAAQHMRCFNWSTVSRLTSAVNPESGTASYTYDSNGNLKTRTDAIGNVMSVAAYDHLNRPIGASAGAPAINYTISSPTSVTPSVTYAYDQDFKGAVSSISSSVSSTSYTHDDFGRIASNTQNTNGNSYTFSYTYSNTDFLTSIKYPSGRQVGYTPDAADRLGSVQNLTGGGNYASFSYKASGAVNTMSTGNNVTQQFAWNDRIQPMSLAVTGPGATSLLTLGFYPCGSQSVTYCATGNNGNLQSQTIQMPGLSLNQTYTYDAVNRLTGAQESGTLNGSSVSGWSQSFGYDPLGNRWAGASFALSSQVPQSSNWFANAAYCATLSPGQPCPLNQIVQGGWSYDKAGNLLQVGGMSRSFTYDAENRQVTANISGAASSYLYDGLGQRVSRNANSETVTYVYDAFGNVGAEYSTVSHASPCGTATCYTAMDHLGSTRLLTDLSGMAQRRYDYLPFGDELLAGATGRGTSMGYQSTPDGVNPKFTGQDRDTETADPTSQSGSDWFNTRYMSSAQGRFQSVDPANAGADLGNPGTWNGYAYVGNSPLSYTDQSGMFIEAAGLGSAGGPVGTIIGVVIDIGELLGGLFGFGGGGGGGGQPPPAPLPQTNISLTAPGSDQDSSGSPFGVGNVFGSGNTSPFGFPGRGICPAGPFANCLAPTPMTIGQTLSQYALGTLSNVIGAAGLIFTTAGRTQQDEAVWLKTGRLPGLATTASPSITGKKPDIRKFEYYIRLYEKRCGVQLTREQRRRLHDAITRQDLTEEEIIEEAIQLFGCPNPSR